MKTPAPSKLAETAAFLDAIYGRCSVEDGALVAVAASRREMIGAMPLGDGGGLTKMAELMHRHPGAYLKVNGMDYSAIQYRIGDTGKPAVGNQSEVRTVVAFIADVDAGKSAKYVSRSAALWAIESMPLSPSMIINSGGSDGGFHVYWLLDKPVRVCDDNHRRELAAVSKAWQAKLRERLGGKLDNTSNLDRVLRVVGVPRLDGLAVTCERCQFDRLYSVDDFS